MDELRIESHGIIGDLGTTALVGVEGSIDFLCWPEFDSPTVFAALLDAQKGGRFQVSPVTEGSRTKQLYLPDTNVLLTRFLYPEGVAELSDFMVAPLDPDVRAVVRRAKSVRGDIDFRMECAPRFDYGRAKHRVDRRAENELVFRELRPDGLAFLLRADVPLLVRDGDAIAEFRLSQGQSASFVLEALEPGRPGACSAPGFVSETFKATNDYWRRWIGRSTYAGRWRETVHRSALTLKLLTSERHGSMVASPTFGLPEHRGGTRNWDYRYSWIRDASFTLYALNRLGFDDEASAFMRWIEQRCTELRPDGSLQIMYGLDGRHALAEETLPHLAGHGGARPVRIGNGAFRQLQLDIYGELLDAVYLHDKFGKQISHDLWANLVRLIDWVCENWRRRDAGIWEVRGGDQEFLLSRVMCWVAVDRGLRLALRRSFPAPVARWHDVRDEIYGSIFAEFWDPGRQTFVQHRGSTATDASVLLMPLMRFIGPTDPRWLSTLAAVEHDLVEDSLVFRYRPALAAPDGFPEDEGTFNMCSFWYVEALARSGDVDQARFCFEKALGYANHLGLYSEELSPSGDHLGNFPQAFTHLALISAAFCLDRELGRMGRPS